MIKEIEPGDQVFSYDEEHHDSSSLRSADG